MEHVPVVDHRKDGLLHHRLSLFDGKAASQLQNKIGNIDLAGADLLAIAALDAKALDLVRFLECIKPGS
jgi:hypothetical protein